MKWFVFSFYRKQHIGLKLRLQLCIWVQMDKCFRNMYVCRCCVTRAHRCGCFWCGQYRVHLSWDFQPQERQQFTLNRRLESVIRLTSSVLCSCPPAWHPSVQRFICCSLRTLHRDNQILSWRFHGDAPLNGKSRGVQCSSPRASARSQMTQEWGPRAIYSIFQPPPTQSGQWALRPKRQWQVKKLAGFTDYFFFFLFSLYKKKKKRIVPFSQGTEETVWGWNQSKWNCAFSSTSGEGSEFPCTVFAYSTVAWNPISSDTQGRSGSCKTLAQLSSDLREFRKPLRATQANDFSSWQADMWKTLSPLRCS